MPATATTATATPNYSGQLTAGEYDIITMDRPQDAITVYNMNGTGRIDYTTDGTFPVENGSAGTGRGIPAAIASDYNTQIEHEEAVKVILISSGTPQYQIIGGA
jgi:hypothetical protein